MPSGSERVKHPRRAPSSDIMVLRVLQTRGETRAFYNKISSVYDLLSDHSEAPVREAALQLLSAAEGERVLEIGFGTGHCLVSLAEAVGPTGRIYGIDLSDNMAALARRNLVRAGLDERSEIICGDATRLPYAGDSFNAVLLSFTLELFDTPEIPEVLNECRRVLRRGGRIVVASLSRDERRSFALRAYEWTHRHFPNFLDCRPIYVRQSVEESGFEVIRAVPMKVWVPVLIVLGVKQD